MRQRLQSVPGRARSKAACSSRVGKVDKYELKVGEALLAGLDTTWNRLTTVLVLAAFDPVSSSIYKGCWASDVWATRRVVHHIARQWLGCV